MDEGVKMVSPLEADGAFKFVLPRLPDEDGAAALRFQLYRIVREAPDGKFPGRHSF